MLDGLLQFSGGENVSTLHPRLPITQMTFTNELASYFVFLPHLFKLSWCLPNWIRMRRKVPEYIWSRTTDTRWLYPKFFAVQIQIPIANIHSTKKGADILAENTPNGPNFICPNCLPKTKSLERLHWVSVVRVCKYSIFKT